MRTGLVFLFLLAVAPTTSVGAADAVRATHTQFKGAELYSWKDAGTGVWRFALLPGSNRNKSTSEIKNPAQAIPDVPGLEHRLALLAKGEQVFWSNRDPANFSDPPAATVDAIVKFGATVDVTVTVGH